MNRLFVKIKTDLKRKGTLFEISGKIQVGETLNKIINGMEGLPSMSSESVALNYKMIRLGSPKRLLENGQTFSQTGVRNNDTLLITADAEIIMSQDLFEFETLSLEDQYSSVQDLRAPLRLPIQVTTTRNTVQQVVIQPKPTPQTEDEVDPEKDRLENPFDFQPLDLDISDPAPNTGTADEWKSESDRSTKKKRKI